MRAEDYRSLTEFFWELSSVILGKKLPNRNCFGINLVIFLCAMVGFKERVRIAVRRPNADNRPSQQGAWAVSTVAGFYFSTAPRTPSTIVSLWHTKLVLTKNYFKINIFEKLRISRVIPWTSRSFPKNFGVQNRLTITKNNSQGIIFAILSCQRVITPRICKISSCKSWLWDN